MKRIDYLMLVSNIFQFKTIQDKQGNTYVLFLENELTNIPEIQDRTAFEACENHVHLIKNITKTEFHKCIPVAEAIGHALLCSLQVAFPNKHFIVFVSFCKNDDMIIRFHQKWENEKPYYDPADFQDEYERVFKFEN